MADFQRALKNKYGLGEGDNYKPWLRVQDVRSYGNSGKIQGLKSNREHHTLSEHESCFFYLSEFCDSVIDIREQFPLLPLDLSVKIAKILNIDHPTVKGSRGSVLNVMTTDFVLTRSDGVNSWYEAISVKPESQLGDKRTAEKLDIERIWWQQQQIPFYVFVMTERNKIQSKNIQWFTAPSRQGLQFYDSLMNQAVTLLSTGTVFIEDICNNFIQKLNVEYDYALPLLKMVIATKLIEVNLDKPIADTGILEIMAIPSPGKDDKYAS
ncbi:TnsA endonuclease N-terminal domain-containing protein [Microbulbifer sp. CnH-101-E]|uniref:TnsA endonuclease N-terminal domain-containing protein n=1 Tax=unclassified Microbulbifer TaxID=2619833 RepID=UPI00403933A6